MTRGRFIPFTTWAAWPSIKAAGEKFRLSQMLGANSLDASRAV